MAEKNFITSGRNTIIHKIKKFDLLIINGEDNPVVIVSHRGIGIYKGAMPEKRSLAKKAYQDIVHIESSEVFSEEKTLLFIQSLDGREYKIDYSKVDTKSFIKIHQDNYI
ncbi:hypothetical protein L3081_18935 [Colwellia sp. MSW7]|uniref:Uncharacterized protein n=1 Tax=Colwellia maritima TaxID=2912588 RepID=A0ABS9X6J6_9GAMM|nr:hypothetical protein [Colwellia maritima]MCI2285086.1 hypothetical protein [Colwellia maritima]